MNGFYELSTKKTNNSQPIARIVPFKNILEYIEWLETPQKNREKINETYLYINQFDSVKTDPNKEIRIKEGTILPLMIRQEGCHPNRVFIAGGTLSGKSVMASLLAADYNKQFRKNRIPLFTCVSDCTNFNDNRVKNVFPIRIDENILDDPIALGELHDSCTIFDDIEAHENKDIVKELENLRDRCLKAGRHEKTDVIVTNQTLLGQVKTKAALGNCFQVIAYPYGAGRYQLGQFLHRYMNIKQIDIDKILNVPSRYVLINRTQPLYILFEKGCFIL